MSEHYVSLYDARRLLLERQNNRELMEAVCGWWEERGYGQPPLPVGEPLALLTRQVASARYEDYAFMRMAKQDGLTPVWCEYTGDRFVSESSYKRSLLHRSIVQGKGRADGWKVTQKVRHADIDRWHKHPFYEIECADGQNLVDVHHTLQDQMFDKPRRIDFTHWLKQIGGAKDYYPATLSFFLCHGVLFEDYLVGESGTKQVVLTAGLFEPAFEEVTRRFGVSPLIVRLTWQESMAFYPNPAEGWRKEDMVDLAALGVSAGLHCFNPMWLPPFGRP